MKSVLWLYWLSGIVVSFAGLEGYALYSGTPSTLSDNVVWLTNVWGPLPVVLGMITGGLVTHLWWRWTPAKADQAAECWVCGSAQPSPPGSVIAPVVQPPSR
jgi:hypothetical protein